MKYLLQIYPATDEFVGLSAREQEAIVGEYVAVGQTPGVLIGSLRDGARASGRCPAEPAASVGS